MSNCKGCCHDGCCGYFSDLNTYGLDENGEQKAFEEFCMGCPCGDGLECNRDQGCANYETEDGSPVMTECEMYAKFRAEIEAMYAPLVLKECDEVIKIKYDNQEVGLLCVKDKYIQGLYILPEHRRKGYGKKAILDYIKQYGMLKDLTILNTNYKALAFWNDLFELEVIKANSIDTYYKIKGVK